MIAPTSFFADYGCHVRILEEAQVLGRLGHRVTIATYHNGDPVAGLDIRRTLPVPWRRDYEVGSSRHKIGFDALLGLKCAELLLRGRFDVIHAHLHEGALIGLALGRALRTPVVFDFQGSLTGEMLDHGFVRAGSAGYRFFRRLEEWIDRRSAALFTSSTQAAHLLVNEFGCRPERIRPLPDCVNPAVFLPTAHYDPAELAQRRSELGIPAGRRLIVYLGLLAPYQGTDLLLAALARIVAQRRDVHLLLMGFPHVARYQAQAAALGVSDHVTFTGRVSYFQAPGLLAVGDVAAAPKLSETEGAGKLLNYMAVGLPTVAFDTPAAREYLGHDGLLAVRGDVASLADHLSRALFSEGPAASHYAALGQRLRRRAIRLYGWEAAGHRIVETYRQLCGEGPTAAERAGRPVASERPRPAHAG
jgi:glycosyltransferase involved in cell wall biosynthesis